MIKSRLSFFTVVSYHSRLLVRSFTRIDLGQWWPAIKFNDRNQWSHSKIALIDRTQRSQLRIVANDRSLQSHLVIVVKIVPRVVLTIIHRVILKFVLRILLRHLEVKIDEYLNNKASTRINSYTVLIWITENPSKKLIWMIEKRLKFWNTSAGSYFWGRRLY